VNIALAKEIAMPHQIVAAPGIALLIIISLYIAVCFGRIAAKHGKNPWLFGILSIISPINLIILGIWAFSSSE
jgi:hypothetical protein